MVDFVLEDDGEEFVGFDADGVTVSIFGFDFAGFVAFDNAPDAWDGEAALLEVDLRV